MVVILFAAADVTVSDGSFLLDGKSFGKQQPVNLFVPFSLNSHTHQLCIYVYKSNIMRVQCKNVARVLLAYMLLVFLIR